MTKQYAIPGIGYLHENGTIDHALPGGGYIQETGGSFPAGQFDVSEASTVIVAANVASPVAFTVAETSLMTMAAAKDITFSVSETSTVTIHTTGIKQVGFPVFETSHLTTNVIRDRPVISSISETSAIIFDTAGRKYIGFAVSETSTLTDADIRARKIIVSIHETSSVSLVPHILPRVQNTFTSWWFPTSYFYIDAFKSISANIIEQSTIQLSVSKDIPIDFEVLETSDMHMATTKFVGINISETSSVAINGVKRVEVGGFTSATHSIVTFNAKPWVSVGFAVNVISSETNPSIRNREITFTAQEQAFVSMIPSKNTSFPITEISAMTASAKRNRHLIQTTSTTSAVSLSDHRTRTVEFAANETSNVSATAIKSTATSESFYVGAVSSMVSSVRVQNQLSFTVHENSSFASTVGVQTPVKKATRIKFNITEHSALSFKASTPAHLPITEHSTMAVLSSNRQRKSGALVAERAIIGMNVTSTRSTGTGRNYLIGFYGSSAGMTGLSYNTYLGYHPDFTINDSYQWDNGTYSSTCGGVSNLNSYPVVIDIGIGTTHGGGASITEYNEVAAGLHDAEILQRFQNQPGPNSIYGVRIDSEFNLSSNWQTVGASTYKAAWNRVANIGKTVLPNAKFIWNPNYDLGDTTNYVPSAADIIGVDVYSNPVYRGSNSTIAWNYIKTLSPGGLDWYASLATAVGKPLAFPECGDDYGDGVFISNLATWMNGHNVVLMCYWDSADNEDAHLRGTSYTAFQTAFANVAYTGTYWTRIPTTNYSGY